MVIGGDIMYLLTFDIINSKANDIQMRTVITDEVIAQISDKFEIDQKQIEIVGGDQLRIIHCDVTVINQLIIFVLIILTKGQIKARVFLSTGEYVGTNQPINQMTGQIFYRGQELEKTVKKGKLNKNISIHYLGGKNSEEINLIMNMYSRLAFSKPQYLYSLYKYVYEKKSQTQICKELNLSQSTINNQLKKVNVDLVTSYNNIIIKLIREEICSQNK